MTEGTFGNRVKTLRRGRKMTQAQLAAKIGVTLRALVYWESDEHAPGSQELGSLAGALQLTKEERQALIVLLPTGKAGKLARVMPVWADLAPPPGTGDLIRALRWRKRFSPEQLAHALGVHRTTVLRWEASQAAPNEETRLRLCDVLGAFPAERAVLLASGSAAPWWNESLPTLDACREKTARLERDSMGQMDSLFDLRAHLLAGTLWNLSAHQPQARPMLAQAYAAHAAYSCLRGDDVAALDYSRRSLNLIREGAAPPEAAWYRAVWASNHALIHRAPKTGAKHGLRQVREWLPQTRTSDTRAAFLLSATSCATQGGVLLEAREYWSQTLALTDRSPHSSPHFIDSMRSVYADLLVEEGHYDAGLEVNSQIASDLYPRQINRLLFETLVFLKSGEKNEADASLRRAYSLISAHQVDLYRKEADGYAAQLERLT